jgi:hypothetical protein
MGRLSFAGSFGFISIGYSNRSMEHEGMVDKLRYGLGLSGQRSNNL